MSKANTSFAVGSVAEFGVSLKIVLGLHMSILYGPNTGVSIVANERGKGIRSHEVRIVLRKFKVRVVCGRVSVE